MKAFEAIDRCAETWGAWMFGMTWQAALLVLIVALLARICRSRSAVLLHTLWLLVLVRLVVPPAFAFPTGWAFWLLPAAGAMHVAGEIRPPQVPVATTANSAASGENGVSNGQSVAGPEAAPLPAAESTVGASPGVPAVAAESHPAMSRPWTTYLMLTWAGIAATLIGFLGWGQMRVRQWVREAEPIDDPELYSLLEDCRERLGISRIVELRNSQTCTTPVVVGFRRPVILLPSALLTGLTAGEMHAVLMHELVHVVRSDSVVNLAQGLLGALYFFHPLVWWANSELRRLREEACDELTVTALDGQRRTYGEAIVKVTELFGYASPPLALGVMESKSPARERLRRILDPQLPQGGKLSWQSLAGIGVLAAFLLPGAAGPSQAKQDPQATMISTGPSESKGRDDAKLGDIRQPIAAPAPAIEDGLAQNELATPEEPAGFAPVKPAPASLPALPRYRWQAGKTYVYSVRIEADEPEAVEVYSGTPGYVVRATGIDGTELVVSGRLMQSQKLKPDRNGPFGLPPRFRGPFSSFSGVGIQPFPGEEHVLKINDRGNAQSVRGQSQLPYMLGNLSQLMIVPLPEEGRDRWDENEKTGINLLPEDNDRFPRPPFGPFAGRSQGERLEAREKSTFAVTPGEHGVVVIRKTYELKTTETENGNPRMALSGEAEYTFDPVRGVTTALAGKYRLTNNSGNNTYRVPITIAARLLSEDEQSRLEAERLEAARRKPLDDSAIDAALADLESGSASLIQRAATRLERAEPQGRQADVALALAAQLDNQDNSVRLWVVRALTVWGTPESVPALIKGLDDEHFPVVWGALEALEKLKDERSIEPIVALIKSKKQRQRAVQTLAAMGPMVEAAALELLSETDDDIRYDACLVLKEVGGKASRGPLGKVARSDTNGIVRLVAEQALKEIAGRQK